MANVVFNRLFHMVLLSAVSFCGAQASESRPPDITRQQLYRALLSNKALDPERSIVHLSHVCNLRIGNSYYPVADLREIVKGVATPRGVNTIIILNSSLQPVQKIDYTKERPLFCKDNQLFLWGDLRVYGISSEGNAISFTEGGKKMELRHVEANDYPVPATKDAGGTLQ